MNFGNDDTRTYSSFKEICLINESFWFMKWIILIHETAIVSWAINAKHTDTKWSYWRYNLSQSILMVQSNIIFNIMTICHGISLHPSFWGTYYRTLWHWQENSNLDSNQNLQKLQVQTKSILKSCKNNPK